MHIIVAESPIARAEAQAKEKKAGAFLPGREPARSIPSFGSKSIYGYRSKQLEHRY